MLFRLSGGVRHDAAVDRWLAGRDEPQGAIARSWFDAMRGCGGDVGELMHDGCPVACVADAPFGYVNVFTDHVNVGFFQGAALDDPSGLLEGVGKRMRHVKVRLGRPADNAALSALIAAAYRDIRLRLRSEGGEA